MKKRILSYVLVVFGIAFISLSPIITGDAIGENLSKISGSIVGIVFVIAGIVVFLLEDKLNQNGLAIMVSTKAFERLNKDKFVKNNKKWFFNEINRIAQNPQARPQEKIGKFSVSPRGESPRGSRVAWSYNSQTNTLYVLDLLYHEKERKYVDDWNNKVLRGQINPSNYSHYIPFEEAA